MVKEFEDILIEVFAKRLPDDRNEIVKLLGLEVLKDVLGDDKIEEYNRLFGSVEKDRIVFDQYHRVIKFYYFWSKRPVVANTLRSEFHLIVVFSIMEYLMGAEKYLSFYNWLKKKICDEGINVNNSDHLNNLYEEYLNIFGTNKAIKNYFKEYFPKDILEEFRKSIKILDLHERKFIECESIDRAIRFILELRHRFIHQARDIILRKECDIQKEGDLYNCFSIDAAVKLKGKFLKIHLNNITIEKFLLGFEYSLKNYFIDMIKKR